MPRKREISEDESYTECSPVKYRRYNKMTKTKYCFLVKRLGWKPSSAAKLLKIKGSTAKMILKNFQHEDFDELGQKLKGKYCKKKPRGQKQEKMITEVAKVEQNEQMVCFFVYFGLDPVMMYQQTWP